MNIILAQELRGESKRASAEASVTATRRKRFGGVCYWVTRDLVRQRTSRASSSTTAKPWQCSARTHCAANADFRRFGGYVPTRLSPAIPALSSIRTRSHPLPRSRTVRTERSLTAAQLIPGTANYTDNVTDNDILPEQTYAERICECLEQGDGTMGDSG